jgi:hypothetical protein
MLEKRYFYEKFGVQEYYIYDPDLNILEGWRREGPGLARVDPMAGWVSPLLGITFDWSPEGLRLIRPDGKAFETFDEVTSRADSAETLVAQARQEIAEERRRADDERRKATQAEERAEAERNRAEALEARLRQLLGDDFSG